MAWTFLLVAGLLEICWAIGLKYSEGFTRLWPTVGNPPWLWQRVSAASLTP